MENSDNSVVRFGITGPVIIVLREGMSAVAWQVGNENTNYIYSDMTIQDVLRLMLIPPGKDDINGICDKYKKMLIDIIGTNGGKGKIYYTDDTRTFADFNFNPKVQALYFYDYK